MRYHFLLFTFFLISCQESRKKDFQETFFSELIYENNGVYYTSDANHNDMEYTGEAKFYFENGKLKGKAVIRNGIPEGHWEYWNDGGNKKLDLYFENGIVTKRIVHLTKN